jgi:biotin carboxylase
VQVLLGYEEVLGVFASKNTLMYGMPFTIEVVDDPTLISSALAIAHSLQEQGLIGPCNLQAKKDVDDGFVFFEVNARFTGITPVRTQMGFNEVIAAYYYFVHHQLPVDCLTFRPDQLACRFLSESIFTKKDIESLMIKKIWVKELE